MRRKTRTKGARAIRAARLHWMTHFTHVHGHTPDEVVTASDERALLDIVLVQSHGDEERSLSLLEEIIRAPIHGETLHLRYAYFWSWVAHGSPKRLPRRFVYEYGTAIDAIARNLRSVA